MGKKFSVPPPHLSDSSPVAEDSSSWGTGGAKFQSLEFWGAFSNRWNSGGAHSRRRLAPS